ncbi:hypothetical protein [Bradyrhizobium canariense]|uniref:hypothetical protein n=1 Tax=Bradyrhizobium canariense TaxID=255045 RepID=UPI0026CEA8AD
MPAAARYRKDGKRLNRKRHLMRSSHFHLFGGCTPLGGSQVELGPFGVPKLPRSNKNQWRQFQRQPRYGMSLKAIDCTQQAPTALGSTIVAR